MNALLIVPPLIAIFAYVSTNWGEQRALKPGWRPAVIVLLWCLAGYLLWPWIAPYILWTIPK